jgi:tetratricopeptide (TPR) repeat protein
LKKFIAFTLIFILLCPLTQAWTITRELQKELNEKKAIVAKNPNDPQAHFDLAVTYAYTNNILEGWDELKKVNQLDPDFKNKAYKMYISRVNAAPSDWKLRFRLAFAYYFNSKKKEAIKELKNVLILDPFNVWAYGYISLIYGEMGEIDQAIEAAKAGLKIDSLVAALHLLLAEGYYKKGDSWNGFWERATALRLKVQGY